MTWVRYDVNVECNSDTTWYLFLIYSSLFKNRWSIIAARLPGRTDNEIKNYWNTSIRKRLLQMGIDPVTHRPRLDLLDLSSILTSSLYNPHEIDLSRFFGPQQPLRNPELSRLASSLGNPNDQVLSPLAPVVQENSNCSTLTPPYVTFPSEAQIMEPNLNPFSSNYAEFSPGSCQLNEWQSNEIPSDLGGDYLRLLKFGYCQSAQSIVDSLSTDQNKVNNLGFGSGLSTPSSSPGMLDSTSTFVGFDGSSTAKGGRESYSCSNMLKFEVPDVVNNVNEFV